MEMLSVSVIYYTQHNANASGWDYYQLPLHWYLQNAQYIYSSLTQSIRSGYVGSCLVHPANVSLVMCQNLNVFVTNKGNNVANGSCRAHNFYINNLNFQLHTDGMKVTMDKS